MYINVDNVEYAGFGVKTTFQPFSSPTFQPLIAVHPAVRQEERGSGPRVFWLDSSGFGVMVCVFFKICFFTVSVSCFEAFRLATTWQQTELQCASDIAKLNEWSRKFDIFASQQAI